ncbi:MAG: hypothetical protein ACXV5Q_07990 [Frankiaceae bacterium]
MNPAPTAPRPAVDRPPQPNLSRAAREARLIALLGRDAHPAQAARAALTGVSDAELDRWISVLARYQHACGCKSGAASAMLVLVLWPAVGLRQRSVSSARGAGAALVVWAGATVTGAAAGKIGGLAVSAAARRLLLRRIPAANAPRGTDR